MRLARLASPLSKVLWQRTVRLPQRFPSLAVAGQPSLVQWSNQRLFSEVSESRCPFCGAPAAPFVCRSCGSLQPPDYGSASHYKLLGLSETFEVDAVLLENSYKELQRMLHPDRHVAASEEIREWAEVHSARVNEAVAVLRTPLRRAEYWMKLKGQAVLLEEQRIEDASTMMEVMETSEELEEAKTQEQVDAIRARNNSKIRAVESELSDLFGKEDWTAARRRVERLQMLTRLQERMDDWRAS
mmetsp:Transcript_33574/g.75346  ORF Transcript_33574/g.75346 Transcript_33574/m.75346 type:complete len:243 (-) Transcript_33574:49-777(-)